MMTVAIYNNYEKRYGISIYEKSGVIVTQKKGSGDVTLKGKSILGRG